MLPPLHPSLVRNVIYPLYRGLRNDQLLGYLDTLERNQWLEPSRLEEIKWRKLEKLLKEATRHVPYYRKLFREHGIRVKNINSYSDLAEIPFLTRERIRRYGNSMISTDPFRRGHPSRTAGTTGKPLRFYYDSSASPLKRASMLRADRWAGMDLGDREFKLWGLPPDEPGGERISRWLKNYLNNIFAFSALDMSEHSMSKYASALKRLKPGYISGYPSALEMFADFIRINSLEVGNPRSVITGGEKLYPGQRNIIEGVFGCPAYERYGCREFSYLAQECEEHEGLHLFSDLFLVEVIHQNGRPAGSGEAGELVVTDLTNRYMPFIRYRTGDFAIPAGRTCSCGRGFPLLHSIQGPSLDRVVTPDGGKIGSFLWPRLLNGIPGVENFQIEQRDSNGIILKLVTDDEWRDEYSELIETRITRNCGEDFRVSFARVDDIPQDSPGNYRLVKSDMQERLLIKTKIHKATITGVDPEGFDSLTVDLELMRCGNLNPGEKVLIVDNTNGARVETTVREGEEGSGEIVVAGAAGRHIHRGDEVSVMAFTWAGTTGGKFNNILVDEDNRFVRYLTDRAGDKI